MLARCLFDDDGTTCSTMSAALASPAVSKAIRLTTATTALGYQQPLVRVCSRAWVQQAMLGDTCAHLGACMRCNNPPGCHLVLLSFCLGVISWHNIGQPQLLLVTHITPLAPLAWTPQTPLRPCPCFTPDPLPASPSAPRSWAMP